MVDFKKILHSKKVILRPLKADDFDEMKLLTQVPEMWTYFTSDLSNHSDLKNWIDNAITDRQSKKRLAFTVLNKENNEIIGSTSIGNFSLRDKRIEIGWTWVSKKYQGKGYNSHVKKLLLNYCFNECNAERVEFKTDVLNIPAKKALQKIGATEEGVLRSHTQMIKNRRRDTIFYSFLRDEWNENKFN